MRLALEKHVADLKVAEGEVLSFDVDVFVFVSGKSLERMLFAIIANKIHWGIWGEVFKWKAYNYIS